MIRRTFRTVPPHGDPIDADLRLPEGTAEGAVVVAHGFKGFKDWGFFPYLCDRLADAGFVTVSFNFSLNGVRPHAPDAFTDLEAFARNTVSRELEDLQWMLAGTEEGAWLPGAPERVGLLGHSRGGGAAVLAARERERLDALVTWCAIATFDRWDEATKEEWRDRGRIHVENARTGQQMPLGLQLLEDYEANRERFDVEAAARQLSCPWLVVHGEDDESVPDSEARRLARATDSAELLVIEGAGHTFEVGHPFSGPSRELERVVDVSVRHFRRHLAVHR